MRIRLIKLINSRAARFVAVVFILLLGFQNCGKGFQAAKAKTDSSESARTAEGQILPFDPYQDSGNPAEQGCEDDAHQGVGEGE